VALARFSTLKIPSQGETFPLLKIFVEAKPFGSEGGEVTGGAHTVIVHRVEERGVRSLLPKGWEFGVYILTGRISGGILTRNFRVLN
jgi:hypothetical protein